MAPDVSALSPEELERIYRTLIQPVIFHAAPSDQDTPTLVLLGGQPGAGKSRASARLSAEHDGNLALLSGDDLRIFHPDYLRLITADPEQAGVPLAEATRVWVREAIGDALESRRSLLLEGSFGDPETTLDTAERFRRAGFHVRIVAIASPRVLSVVTAASRYLRDLRVGAPARFTRLSAHDRGYDGTARLTDSLDSNAAVDRITILSRGGDVLYDRSRGEGDEPPASVREALRNGRYPATWGARSTMELLGELKQITTYAIASGHLTPDVADLLIEAHTLALADVAPRLSISADSPQAKFIRQTVGEQSITLRRAIEGSDVDTEAFSPTLPPSDLGTLDR